MNGANSMIFCFRCFNEQFLPQGIYDISDPIANNCPSICLVSYMISREKTQVVKMLPIWSRYRLKLLAQFDLSRAFLRPNSPPPVQHFNIIEYSILSASSVAVSDLLSALCFVNSNLKLLRWWPSTVFNPAPSSAATFDQPTPNTLSALSANSASSAKKL